MTDIFRKDRHNWTPAQEEQVEYFFRCNEFFSKFYEQHYFEDIIQLAYYCKISPDSPLYLTDNKRPVAIVLLQGNIAIFKRQNPVLSKKNRNNSANNQAVPEFVKISECLRYNQTLIQSAECKVAAIHGKEAEILFVPSFVYNRFIQKSKEDKDRVIFNMLSKIFRKVQNRYIMDLARSGCKVVELHINNYIYQYGHKPQSVFIVIEGTAKIEKPGFSHKNFDIVVVSTDSILGDKDLCYSQRETSAICCSASIRLLEIPKEAYLRFAKLCLPEVKLQHKQNSLSPSKSRKQSPKKEQDHKLPMILRFRSARRSEEEQAQEYRLIKNSHVLLESCKPSKSRIRSKSSFSDYPRDMMEQKIKLFKKLRPVETKLDISNRIF